MRNPRANSYNVPVMLHPRFVADLLRRSARAYAGAASALLAEMRPDFAHMRQPELFTDVRSELEGRVLQIAEGIAVDAPELTADVVGWYRVAYSHRRVPDEYLQLGFAAIAQVLATELPEGAREIAARHLAAAELASRMSPRELPSFLQSNGPHVDVARQFLLAVLEDRPEDAVALARRLLDSGMSVADLHDRVLADVQREVGRMWMMGEVPVADEHQCSLVVSRVLDLIQERLPRPQPGAARVLAFSAGGNLHDLGIRVVGQRLQIAGFAVTNLGGNLPTSDLPYVFADRRFDLIAVSATMLAHLGEAVHLVEDVRKLCTHPVKILLGGRPFALVSDLHVRLGADAGAGDAVQAVQAAISLTSRAH